MEKMELVADHANPVQSVSRAPANVALVPGMTTGMTKRGWPVCLWLMWLVTPLQGPKPGLMAFCELRTNRC